MQEIIAIINQKGGVGKSTTALALGAGLAAKGQRVLFIDMDAQGNLSYALGAQSGSQTIYEVLRRETDAESAIQHTGWGVDLLPASPSLSGADTVLIEVGKEFRLREALEPLEGDYDFILIDTPPALGILTVNALTAASSVIIPAQADIFSLQGIGQLYGTINTVKRYCNAGLSVQGILLTRYNPRAILSRDIADMTRETAKQFETTMFDTTIREGIAVKEAQASKENLFDYAPKSNVAADYQAFVDEFWQRRQ